MFSLLTCPLIIASLLFILNLSDSKYNEDHWSCPPNHFKLEGMGFCHPWIGCEDIENLKIVKRLGTGAVKDVFLVNWKNFFVVLSVPVNFTFLEDFMNGVRFLKQLNTNEYIVKFLGFCENSYALFTEYHPLGNAADFLIKNTSVLSVFQSVEYCHQYSLILKYLHNGPAGRRVFCDSNSLEKLLSQLLVSKDLKLILNDVDALPEVSNSSGVKCGHKQLYGTFVAPEQLWIRNDEFNIDLMPGYDEKTDIWKAAAVCDHFLKKADDGERIRYRLFGFHKQCRNYDSSLRPSTEELVREYETVIEELRIHSEL